MNVKSFLLYFLVVLVFVFGITVGDALSTFKHKAVIVRLQGESNIYKSEAERYARVIRAIREQATLATVVEKAK